MRKSLLVASLLIMGCNSDPGNSELTPLYRTIDGFAPTQGERGSIIINEINFAGSVSDSGTYDADDVFIELRNKLSRPVNISGWRLEVDGDFPGAYRIPPHESLIYPNEFFVIARKPDGAFGDVADVFIEDLELGRKYVEISMRDIDRVRIDDVGSTEARVFAGGYDTVSVRSMERVNLIFGNRGGNQRNWHAYSDNEGTDQIKEGFRELTLATPGEANSQDYSGNASSGNFE